MSESPSSPPSVSPWGPENPHPLSRVGTELLWEGKYDVEGQRRLPCPAALALPLEKVAAYGHGPARGRLFHGDNRLMMASLLEEYRGKVDLIYIDPPYDADAEFGMKLPVGHTPGALECVAYRDRWGRGSESYLQMMYERLWLMRELLSERGTLYVHVDYRMQGYLRAMLAELFGEECFMNEIVWSYKTGGTPEAFGFARKHDTLLVFRKGARPIFNSILQKSYARTLPEPHTDSGSRLGVLRDESCDLCGNGAPGQKYRQVRCRDVWEDLNSIFRNDTQSTGYATQKPEALLERIITASSNEGSLVADFFCGSGTTGAVAERLGRRWLMSDLGAHAVQTSLKRMLELPEVSFELYRLSPPAERRLWSRERLGGAYREALQAAFGTAEQRALYVAEPEETLGPERVSELASCLEGDVVSLLAWDFAPGLHSSLPKIEATTGKTIHLRRIPREIMESNRPIPPIFPEEPLLEAEIEPDGHIRLSRYTPSWVGIDQEERQRLEEASGDGLGLGFIDFWAVGPIACPDEAFRPVWHAYRTKQRRELPMISAALPLTEAEWSHGVSLRTVDVFGQECEIVLSISR